MMQRRQAVAGQQGGTGGRTVAATGSSSSSKESATEGVVHFGGGDVSNNECCCLISYHTKEQHVKEHACKEQATKKDACTDTKFFSSSNPGRHTTHDTHTHMRTHLQLALACQHLQKRPPALLSAGVHKRRPILHDQVHENCPLLCIEGTHLERQTCRGRQQRQQQR